MKTHALTKLHSITYRKQSLTAPSTETPKYRHFILVFRSRFGDEAASQTIEELGFDSRQGQEIFSPPKCPDRFWNPHSLLSSGYRKSLYSEAKQSEREADHSPIPTANMCLYVAHRGNFTVIQVPTRLFARLTGMAVNRMFTTDTCPVYVRFF